MTKLEQLIKELCPDGVKYKALGDVVEILDSQRKPVTKKDRQSGIYHTMGQMVYRITLMTIFLMEHSY
jgi:type I restriction enzyme S subunit